MIFSKWRLLYPRMKKLARTLFLIVFSGFLTWMLINLTWTPDTSRKLRGNSKIDSIKAKVLKKYYIRGNHSNHRGYYGNNRSHGNIDNGTRTRKLPHCIIIGVRKGGTRALMDFLNIHPGIVSARKEVHFFNDDQNYNLGFDWYRSQMPLSYANQITIEKTPKYFVTRGVPERIAKMNSSIKLILIVREPIQRAISDYAQLKRKGKGPKGFEEAAIDNVTGRVLLKFRSVAYSLYYVHLRRWLTYFQMQQILVLNSEYFTKNPSKTLAKIERFLNLPRILTEDKFYYNETKGFYCINKYLELLGKKGMAGGCLGSSKGIEHPNISAAVRHKLRDFFQPFNKVFFETIGEDFHWT